MAVGTVAPGKSAAVTQALVKLLAEHGGVSLSDSTKPVEPVTLDSPGGSQSPLQLANALAACVISMRLGASYRQWAAQMLVCSKFTKISFFAGRYRDVLAPF